MPRPRATLRPTIVIILLCVAAFSLRLLYSGHRTPLSLSNRTVVEGLEGGNGSERLYRLAVPEGATNLQFSVFVGEGADAITLYARSGELPTPAEYEMQAHAVGSVGLLSIPAPHAGTWYLLLRGTRGTYRGVSLAASYSLPGESFRIGMHAHRLYNGGDEGGPASIEPAFHYGVIRDWDISHLQDAVIWKPDGSIDFSLVDQVYASHAKRGAQVIKTFASVPAWAAKRPNEANHKFPAWPGSLSGPRDLNAYEDYVFRFVSHTKNYLWAVEGWNEPYPCPGDAQPEFTTMTPTELADVQKRLYLAAKRADPNVLVLSPAQAYLCGIPTVLGARTSQGEPISRFFDVFAWHAYNRSARGNAGPSYAEEIRKVRRYLAQAGLGGMPIADTEHGWLPAPKEGGKEFRALSDQAKGKVLYETAQLGKSMGLLALVWYGYDDQFMGEPMTSLMLSQYLQRMYSDLNAAPSSASKPVRP